MFSLHRVVLAAASRRSGGRSVTARPLRAFLERPELVPLGPQALDIPHALSAAERVLEQYDCRAIVVNADPFAAAVAGALLSRRKRVPLLLDFRDPWALCSLRRPLRKRWVESSVAKLERFAVSASERVILNTGASAARLRGALRGPSRRALRLHPEPRRSTLTAAPAEHAPATRRFTLLFAGTLRRFVEGDVLLALLSELKRRGVKSRSARPRDRRARPLRTFLHRAAELGLAEMIELEPPVSYLDVPALLDRADLLVVLSHRDRQRIPAKVYDYALSRRPLLVVSEKPGARSALAARRRRDRIFLTMRSNQWPNSSSARLAGARARGDPPFRVDERPGREPSSLPSWMKRSVETNRARSRKQHCK